MKTIEDLINGGYRYHHSALEAGYQTVKGIRITEYTGRFGTGYKVYQNNPRSTYYVRIHYYIKEK